MPNVHNGGTRFSVGTANRSPSLQLQRNLRAYQAALELVLRHANSIMVIDPHFDPSERRYRNAVTLLTDAGRRLPVPLIEIHRVVWYGNGGISALSWRLLNKPSACAQEGCCIVRIDLPGLSLGRLA